MFVDNNYLNINKDTQSTVSALLFFSKTAETTLLLGSKYNKFRILKIILLEYTPHPLPQRLLMAQ